MIKHETSEIIVQLFQTLLLYHKPFFLLNFYLEYEVNLIRMQEKQTHWRRARVIVILLIGQPRHHEEWNTFWGDILAIGEKVHMDQLMGDC